MEGDIVINEYTATVLECLFRGLEDADYNEIFDAAVYLYCYAAKAKIYPEIVTDAFLSAAGILFHLTAEQFLRVKSIYVR